MRLHGKAIMSAGIAAFVLLVTFPLWYGGAGKPSPPDLRLDTPAIQELGEKRCVEDTAVMRSRHVQLLTAWRDEAVRKGNRTYTAADGRRFEASLSRTCLRCHSNKEQFCDQCHDYAGAKPDCFRCHVAPGEVGK
ncbi:MAG: sulfate reduction electron transfer complex DsrMKJOP subunit DsrJ [Syntrophaceae bacterium]|nr:sulfate reduction electron transfer complex DsrMKJOP subunit DsrJ [Syntrophaceae bacterium]